MKHRPAFGSYHEWSNRRSFEESQCSKWLLRILPSSRCCQCGEIPFTACKHHSKGGWDWWSKQWWFHRASPCLVPEQSLGLIVRKPFPSQKLKARTCMPLRRAGHQQKPMDKSEKNNQILQRGKSKPVCPTLHMKILLSPTQNTGLKQQSWKQVC